MPSDKDTEIFCRNVAWLRQTHGLSQKEMARRLHIGVGSLRQLEQGRLPPRMGALVFLHIHKAFGLPPAMLFQPQYPEE